MNTSQARQIISMAAASAIALSAAYAMAQQNNASNPGDIKPAQAGSPAAHPTGSTGTIERQATDRQNNGQPVTTERTRTDSTRRTVNREERNDRESNLDRQLAACLLTKNNGEVELGKFASKRAKDRDVKEFAEQMVKDHSKVVDTLEQIVGSQQPNDRRSQIAREIDEECLASLKKELSNKSANEFDACYIGSQIAGHMQMAATLKVVSEHSSGKLREVVSEVRPTVDEHLARAKKLMEQLDKPHDRAQASKDRSDRTR
jgi:putative membrane protein